MVLTRSLWGASSRGAPQPRRFRGERGSQALEFALTLPALALVVALVLHAAVLGADLVAAQAAARHAVRAVAVADRELEDAARVAVTQVLGGATVEVRVREDAAEALVTVSVRLRSRAFAAFGATVWVPAEAVMRREGP